jgi:hypothetical protein
VKPLVSIYIPYYVPIAYKRTNNKIYVTTISILRGTSVSIYNDFSGLDINCQLSGSVKTVLDELYDTLGNKLGIVIAVDAPPFWELGVQSSIILGVHLALKSLSTSSFNMKSIYSEIIKTTKKLTDLQWILYLNFSKGLSKFIINNDELESYDVTPIERNEMRIVVGVKAKGDAPEWIRENNLREPDEEALKILKWMPTTNLNYHWNNMDIKIVSLQRLRSVVEDIINDYAPEEIVVSQPDNIGVRIYKF